GYAATCTEAGQKTYYVCERCDKRFEDDTASVEITNHDSTIPAPGHDWKNATCTTSKTCQVCGATEGDANGHTASDWITDETGHWKVCTICNTVIDGSKADHADGNEDGKCDTCGYVMAQSYVIIEGMDSQWTMNSNEPLTFRADVEFSQFTGVELDGVPVDSGNYTAVSGSTIVTLKEEYLKTLPAGEHTLTMVFRSGSASTNFEIKTDTGNPTDNISPSTGDTSLLMLWISLLLTGTVGIVSMIFVSKRKLTNRTYEK
ncbi:MAG: X2-like carbohydrate binding domain-containing protein, partial [Lachnospiraceae bacterium]